MPLGISTEALSSLTSAESPDGKLDDVKAQRITAKRQRMDTLGLSKQRVERSASTRCSPSNSFEQHKVGSKSVLLSSRNMSQNNDTYFRVLIVYEGELQGRHRVSMKKQPCCF